MATTQRYGSGVCTIVGCDGPAGLGGFCNDHRPWYPKFFSCGHRQDEWNNERCPSHGVFRCIHCCERCAS